MPTVQLSDGRKAYVRCSHKMDKNGSRMITRLSVELTPKHELDNVRFAETSYVHKHGFCKALGRLKCREQIKKKIHSSGMMLHISRQYDYNDPLKLSDRKRIYMALFPECHQATLKALARKKAQEKNNDVVNAVLSDHPEALMVTIKELLSLANDAGFTVIDKEQATAILDGKLKPLIVIPEEEMENIPEQVHDIGVRVIPGQSPPKLDTARGED